MATTTNFNWETPDDTDLVKDGAAAIRTLGSSIDTSFVDLKGGTTGQVLAKASGTDLDFSWVAQDDSNAIQNAIVDAKGDLISATAADTPARLAVGTNGQVLTADSTAATGLVWATPSSGGLVLLNTTSFSAVASQSINDVFSTTYNNYKIVIYTSADSDRDMQLRLRVSGSDNSTASSYNWHRQASFSGTALLADRTDTYWNIGASATAAKFPQIIELGNPFIAEPTGITAVGGRHTLSQFMTGYHNQSTSYTGFTLFPNTGTITGSVSVYGYSK